MSMIGNLARVPDNVRVALHDEPERISKLLYPDPEDTPSKKVGFFSRLFGQKKVIQPNNVEQSIPENDSIDIDKTWHALHFLFTGSDWEGGFPEGFLVSCGQPVGEVDVGYGPAKSFTPAEVKQISDFLASLDRDALRGRFDPAKMAKMEIYPSIWKDSKHPEEDWAYIEGGLADVTAFVTEAAQKNLALLVYIN